MLAGTAFAALAGVLDPEAAKARIRNAALVLYAQDGEDGTSMRAVAGTAEVTVGLVVHHFRTKDGLRGAVDQHVVDLFAGGDRSRACQRHGGCGRRSP